MEPIWYYYLEEIKNFISISFWGGILARLFLLQQLHSLSWNCHDFCRGFFSQWHNVCLRVFDYFKRNTCNGFWKPLFLIFFSDVFSAVSNLILKIITLKNITLFSSIHTVHTLCLGCMSWLKIRQKCFHCSFAGYAFFKSSDIPPQIFFVIQVLLEITQFILFNSAWYHYKFWKKTPNTSRPVNIKSTPSGQARQCRKSSFYTQDFDLATFTRTLTLNFWMEKKDALH